MRRVYLATLVICILFGSVVDAQPVVPYGNNPSAGRYYNVGDAKIYYEVYGTGRPVVLLHGGVYGYIDEFTPFIDKLKTSYQVICIATRGHGRSESGHTDFTYQQRADDAAKIIRQITNDSVLVLGFSDGGFSGLKLAAEYPALVRKLVAIGVGDKPSDPTAKKFDYSVEGLMKYDSAFFMKRRQLMPEPDRWAQTLTRLNNLYNDDPVSKDVFSRIKCPVLIMSGDRDDYNPMEKVLRCVQYISNAQLSVIPNCHHVVFFCNFPAVWSAIQPFLDSK